MRYDVNEMMLCYAALRPIKEILRGEKRIQKNTHKRILGNSKKAKKKKKPQTDRIPDVNVVPIRINNAV